MWVRRAFYLWLLPSAFILPLWLLVGWVAFDAGAWALLWILFIAIPSVFVGQLVLTLLVRARGTVRAERAVSWWDVLGFGVWHLLTIAVGFYNPAFFVPALVLAIAVALGLFWSSLWQLLREARPGISIVHAADGTAYIPAPHAETPRATRVDDVIVVEERLRPPQS